MTLAQKLYLLCYTVKKEKFQLDNAQGRGQLLRAGAMTELARAGLPDATGGKGWLKFLHDKAHTAETPIRDQLLASGDVVMTREKELGAISINRVSVVHPDSYLASRAVGGGWSA
ncbi:hypothetical protein [Streptomyces sp. NPDC015345]|uniref:hypothetical protein n=1 Tax=Streptomyces sp. NPDC015345 TaxID=3364953 RepID=UPI0036F8AB64